MELTHAHVRIKYKLACVSVIIASRIAVTDLLLPYTSYTRLPNLLCIPPRASCQLHPKYSCVKSMHIDLFASACRRRRRRHHHRRLCLRLDRLRHRLCLQYQLRQLFWPCPPQLLPLSSSSLLGHLRLPSSSWYDASLGGPKNS